jgi:hypothetical protein
MVKGARAAMMALHLSGVVFGRLRTPHRRLPQARDVHALKVECGSNRAFGLECGMSARAALSRLALPCIDKEGDDGLFAERFGGI